MAGRERRRSSAASLELSAASRADWVAAGKSAALIAARASSVNLTSAPSVPINPSISDLICSICALVVVKNFRESALRRWQLALLNDAIDVGEESVAPVETVGNPADNLPEGLQRRFRTIQNAQAADPAPSHASKALKARRAESV